MWYCIGVRNVTGQDSWGREEPLWGPTRQGRIKLRSFAPTAMASASLTRLINKIINSLLLHLLLQTAISHSSSSLCNIYSLSFSETVRVCSIRDSFVLRYNCFELFNLYALQLQEIVSVKSAQRLLITCTQTVCCCSGDFV